MLHATFSPASTSKLLPLFFHNTWIPLRVLLFCVCICVLLGLSTCDSVVIISSWFYCNCCTLGMWGGRNSSCTRKKKNKPGSSQNILIEFNPQGSETRRTQLWEFPFFINLNPQLLLQCWKTEADDCLAVVWALKQLMGATKFFLCHLLSDEHGTQDIWHLSEI